MTREREGKRRVSTLTHSVGKQEGETTLGGVGASRPRHVREGEPILKRKITNEGGDTDVSRYVVHGNYRDPT